MKSLASSSLKRRLSNWPFLLTILLLILIGLLTLYSTLILPTGGLGDKSIFVKQLIFTAVGIIFFLILSKIDLNHLKQWQIVLVIYIFTLALLVATLLFGPPIKNVKRWLIIGPIQIQPSEIAKLTVIITTSVVFSLKEKYNEWFLFLISFLLVLPILVLIYLQPSGSMTLLTLGIWFVLAFMGLNNPIRNITLLSIIILTIGAFLLSSITLNNLWYLLLIPVVIISIFGFYVKDNWKVLITISLSIALLLGMVASVTWNKVLKDYQKTRIVAFISPEEISPDKLFNVNQSKIAIGSGQIFGKGFGNGTQSKRNFLPEFRTDFIFASFAEEFGLVGSIFLMALYTIIIIFCFWHAIASEKDVTLSLICIGVGVKILLEVFTNIGTNTGSIPATGIPLPLMSAGGTITIMTLASLGLVNNIGKKNAKKIRVSSSDLVEVYEK